LRWTSYLHVSHNPVLALVGNKKAVRSNRRSMTRGRGNGMNSDVISEARGIVYRDVRNFLNWDASFRESGARWFANSLGTFVCIKRDNTW
jgi:hypothetical protein